MGVHVTTLDMSDGPPPQIQVCAASQPSCSVPQPVHSELEDASRSVGW